MRFVIPGNELIGLAAAAGFAVPPSITGIVTARDEMRIKVAPRQLLGSFSGMLGGLLPESAQVKMFFIDFVDGRARFRPEIGGSSAISNLAFKLSDGLIAAMLKANNLPPRAIHRDVSGLLVVDPSALLSNSLLGGFSGNLKVTDFAIQGGKLILEATPFGAS